MKWQDKLTKQELAHLKEQGITTLAKVKEVGANQKRMRDKNTLGSEPCWECRYINKKLGLPI